MGDAPAATAARRRLVFPAQRLPLVVLARAAHVGPLAIACVDCHATRR
jgi:hypothetical protein